jgi:hypothetical protein
MGRAKEIIVKVIPSKIANEFVKKYHYSGKTVISQIHLGCFLDDKLHGVLSYGTSTVKNNVINLVENTGWNEFIELNRMAFDDYLPKNSESRCLSISFKLIRKNAPHIKWILSFSDACQSGDGTIYRASGFYLTGINKNTSNILLPNGNIVNTLNFTDGKSKQCLYIRSKGYTSKTKYLNDNYSGWKYIEGFQLHYIYLIDKSCKITVPILPFSKIDEMGAGMYKGKKISLTERKALNVSGEVDLNANSDPEGQRFTN